jgi:hypothetical protein
VLAAGLFARESDTGFNRNCVMTRGRLMGSGHKGAMGGGCGELISERRHGSRRWKQLCAVKQLQTNDGKVIRLLEADNGQASKWGVCGKAVREYKQRASQIKP